MSRRSDVHGALGNALIARFSASNPRIVTSCSHPWASVTFSGARHQFEIELVSEDAQPRIDDVANAVGDCEFDLNGHIVADVHVAGSKPISRGATFSIEALTVEAA
jgi:hypothetical protein